MWVPNERLYQRLAENQGIQRQLCKSHRMTLLPAERLFSRNLQSTVHVSRVRHLGSRHKTHFNSSQSGTLFVKAGCFLQIKSEVIYSANL